MAAIRFAPMIAQTCAAPSNNVSITMGAALTGRSTFELLIPSGSTVGYEIINETQWEEGEGTFTAPNTLTRDTVKANYLGTTARVTFTGSATVISWPPAGSIPLLDTSGHLSLANNLTVAGTGAITGVLSAADGTTGSNVVNYSQFQTGGTFAYITNKLPSGFREMIGTNEITTDGDGNATITFPIAFAASPYLPIVMVSNGDATKSATSVHLVGRSDMQFVVNCPDRISGTFTVNWWARGVAA